MDAAGVYPPIDPLPSLSRLIKDGIGKGYTREDHPSLSSQLFACYSKVQEVKALSEVVGRDELSEEDQAYLAFGDAFERTFIGQSRDENRDIGQSLDRGPTEVGADGSPRQYDRGFGSDRSAEADRNGTGCKRASLALSPFFTSSPNNVIGFPLNVTTPFLSDMVFSFHFITIFFFCIY